MTERQKYYRVVDSDISHQKPVLQTLYVVRKTPKAAWVVHSWAHHYIPEGKDLDRSTRIAYGVRIVYDNARRRYAYPTVELALDSYVQRKRRQIQHAQNTLDHARENLKWAQEAKVQDEYLVFNEPPAHHPFSLKHLM